MLGIGLILNALGIGLFCWLIFELVVYALPFFFGRGGAKMVIRVQAVAAMKTAPMQAQTSRHSNDGTPN
jgi:hypothetical protein